MNRKAVVLLSGGLDSSTVLAYASSKGYKCTGLTFRYGQRHLRETESARAISEAYSIELKEAVINLQDIVASSLTGHGDVDHRSIGEIEESVPNTYVPARNIIMLSVASGLAQTMECNDIMIGANALDYSGYPDCRPEFFGLMEQAINSGTGLHGNERIRITAPLQYLRKYEIVRLGMKLGVPYELTWSCYEGGEKACGKCDSCLLRLKGFKEAGFHDPIKYEYYPDFYTKNE